MKISTDTLSILKNFAVINEGILFTPGNVLRTITPAIYAEATVEESFPKEKGIFNLANLLSVISLFNDPELEFGEDALRIAESDGKAETKYGYAGAGQVSLPHPKKLKKAPEKVINFKLTEEQFSKIQKATSLFNKPELMITSDGSSLRIGTSNHKNQQGNYFSLVLESEPNGLTCNAVFNKEHFNLLKGSYTGFVAPDYTVFSNNSGLNLTYYIGLEPTTSTFGK